MATETKDPLVLAYGMGVDSTSLLVGWPYATIERGVGWGRIQRVYGAVEERE